MTSSFPAVYPLPDNTNLTLSELKTFADHKLNLIVLTYFITNNFTFTYEKYIHK